MMKIILQLEELAQMALAVFGLWLVPIHFPWWAWILLFIAPDISMLGYMMNAKLGAITYNTAHHKGIAIAIMTLGYIGKQDLLLCTGLLLYAHSSFDRIFGYGLKYPDAFKHTHLGWIK